MNTIPTDSKKRKLAAILFIIATALVILTFVINVASYPKVRVSFLFFLSLLCYAAIIIGLFLDKIPFPLVGAGFAGFALTNLISQFQKLTQHVYFLNRIDDPFAFAAYVFAALIIFFTVYGNEKLKELAKKLTVLPLILLLIVSAYKFVLLILMIDSRNNMTSIFLGGISPLVNSILFLIGTVKALDAYVYPEGKPKKTVTRADGSVAEAGDGYIGMAKHVPLLLFTFGVWLYIWIWRATQYTNRAPGEEERNPTKKMLLCMFVPFYSIFWTYKTAQRIDAIAKTRGMSSEIATPCLVLAIFVGIVPPILMQDKINAIALNGNAPAAAPAAEPARDVGESTPAAADGVPEELEKYKRLLDNGIITQEEFEAKKKQLLGL